jgi:DNA-binding CsgD family transcriptional regulator
VVVDTVRAQIKSILAKLGFTRQIELVARLNQF